MKDLLSKKRKLKEDVTIAQECSVILQQKLPSKLKDPRSFTIPCTIGNVTIGKALCDLGASINLMLLSILKKLRVGEVKNTRMALQLADRSIKYLYGIMEDVLVKMDKIIFPANFVILDMDEDSEVPVILGRPFLAIGRALVDMQQGQFMLCLHDEKVTFKVFEIMQHPDDRDTCYRIDTVDSLITVTTLKQNTFADPLEKVVANAIMKIDERSLMRESLERGRVEESRRLELKPLPSHLKYAFVGEKETLPAIRNNTLSQLDEEELLSVEGASQKSAAIYCSKYNLGSKHTSCLWLPQYSISSSPGTKVSPFSIFASTNGPWVPKFYANSMLFCEFWCVLLRASFYKLPLEFVQA
ncbi:uncharacterized protein LOC113859344 [Abrus precatorius]|uniref:Uncharacterized protein LOC113859344 n=1 Tax=Abrus precatorius TaxID=3816 RepID=A0A8B8KX75_ABRPR|nr:uncharacterized protein LOC113859344 [Abrus precatorius]